jgi:hypothetical protein
MADAAFFVLVLLLGLGTPLVLSLLVKPETDDPRTMRRSDAEAYARDRSRKRYGGGEEGHAGGTERDS